MKASNALRFWTEAQTRNMIKAGSPRIRAMRYPGLPKFMVYYPVLSRLKVDNQVLFVIFFLVLQR